jgi:hypothetical protein
MDKSEIRVTAQQLAERLRENPRDASSVIELCDALNLRYRDFAMADSLDEDLHMLLGVI